MSDGTSKVRLGWWEREKFIAALIESDVRIEDLSQQVAQLQSENERLKAILKYYSGEIVYVHASVLEICSEPHAEVTT